MDFCTIKQENVKNDWDKVISDNKPPRSAMKNALSYCDGLDLYSPVTMYHSSVPSSLVSFLYFCNVLMEPLTMLLTHFSQVFTKKVQV